MAVKRAKTSRRSNSSPAGPGKVKRPAASRTTARKAAKKKTVSRKRDVQRGPRKTAPAARSVAAPGGLLKVIEGALDEMKAVNVKVLNVHQLTDITDTMIIASGNSDRHVRSLAERVIEHARKAGFRPTGVEGERDGDWVLVDLQDVIVHIMLPRVREFYRLESLWDVSAARREAAGGGGVI